ncbi:MAG: flagellar basal-body rod protein FlgG [Alphaproteobacteria bacterium]|nr:flagellar basal-body rod protein FlgG [Alphaproteobacteria bacterium]
MRALNIAATGMLAQQLNVDVISNNIANMNTTGYKKQRAEFQDLIYQNLERPGVASSASGNIVPVGIQVGVGVKTGAIGRVTEQGNLAKSENDLDLAISGRGYFQVTLPSGEIAFTRAGNFKRNGDGQLTTSEGYLIEPAITIPPNATSVQISSDGLVQAKVPGQTAMQTLGQLQIATFVNPAGLDAQGDNLFLQTAASGDPTVGLPGADGAGSVMQGFLETSNVNAVEEISSLIVAQRAYEMNARVVTAADDMLQATSQLR